MTNTQWPCWIQMVAIPRFWARVCNYSQLPCLKEKLIVMRAVYITPAIDSGALWWNPFRNEALCRWNSECITAKLLVDAWGYGVYGFVCIKRKAWSTFCSFIWESSSLNSRVLKYLAQYVFNGTRSVCLSVVTSLAGYGASNKGILKNSVGCDSQADYWRLSTRNIIASHNVFYLASMAPCWV
jgi:hypothetical protein